MPSISKLQVLRGFHPLISSFAVYDSANFKRTNSVRVIARNILVAIACTVLYLSLMGVVVLGGWTYYTLDQEWSRRAYYLVVMLCVVQQMFTFTSQAKKSRQVFDALQLLQQIIDNREFLHIFQLVAPCRGALASSFARNIRLFVTNKVN